MSYSPIAADSDTDDAIQLRALAGPSRPHLPTSSSSLRPEPVSPEQLRRSPSPRHVRPPGYEAESDDDEEIQQLMDDLDSSTADEAARRGKRGTEGQDDEDEARFREDEIDSAVAIVRKVVPESDDPSLPGLTPRVFILGTVLCVFGASVSQIFFFKSNAPSFSSFFIILLSFPLGRLSDRFFPERLVPGPFGKKEHLLVAILAGSGANAAYAGEIIAVQSLYYKTDLGMFGGLLLLLSTQLIGFGLSGLTYKLLVRPTVMVWPSQLVTVALYVTLHGGAKELQQQTRDRMRFFLIAFVAIFVWQFLPAYILRTLGSGYDGFGFFNFSLDWSVIGGTGALYTPFFAQSSYFAGLALNLWVIFPILYFGFNLWDAQSFDSPLAAHLYNSTFGRLDVLEILDPDLSLNEDKYAEVGPLRLTPFFALSYGVSFAVLTSALVTVGLWHWGDIKAALWAKKDARADIHVEMLERSYEPVPPSYYAAIFGVNLVAAMVLLTFYPLQLPIWGLFLAIAIAIVFLVPVGIIAAITNTVLGLNVITEFVAGWIWPGKPLANVTFKCMGYMCMLQSLDLSADQKLGLYMKIPPKHLFISQCYGTALGSVVNFLLIQGVIAAKRPYLDGTLNDPTQQWSGRKPEIFFTASIIFGAISPSKFFDGQYHVLYWGFLAGAVLPLVPWLVYKRTGNKFWRQISVPLVLHGSIGPPQTPMNVLIPGFIVSWLSQYWALRYRPRWFEKYCYVLSSALDAGTSINALTIYVLGLGSFWAWWGNSNVDAEHCAPGS
ncbi:hypothetical protein JCM3775_002003 [Rhodotorula graminis]